MAAFELPKSFQWNGVPPVKTVVVFLVFGQLLLLLPGVVWTESTEQDPRGIKKWNVECYPDPQKEPQRCQRDHKSFVCDPDAILTEQQANALDSLIETVSSDSPCLCSTCNSTGGVTIGVALVKNIYLDYHTLPSEEIREFAEILRHNWNLGKCDDDILIFVSSEERTCHTDMGNPVTKLLDNEINLRIFLENRHHFASGDYYSGLEAMIRSYSDVISSEVLKHSPGKTNSSSLGLVVGLTVTFIVLAVLLGGLAFWWTKRKRERENNKRYSWEVSNSLKRSDIIKIQESYMPARTSEMQQPAIADIQKEGYLGSVNEEEEIVFEEPAEVKPLDARSEHDNIELDKEGSEHETQKATDENNSNMPKTSCENEEYFMPRGRTHTQWQPVPTEEDDHNIYT